MNKEKAEAARLKKQQLAELKQKKKEIQRQKKIVAKREKMSKKRADKISQKRLEHTLIQSTQLSVPIRDVLKSIVITKDGRYLKIMEFAPLNFMMYSNEDKNRITMAFDSLLRVIPGKIQFKSFARKAKTEDLLENIEKCYHDETNNMCKQMQYEYMGLIQETALREGVTRRFFAILEYGNDDAPVGVNFDYIVNSLNTTASRIISFMEQAGNHFIPSCETDQGVTALLYEMMNRRASETTPFSARAAKVYNHYLEDARKKGDNRVPPIPATEFISPAWIDYNHSRYLVIDGKFYIFGYVISDSYPNAAYTGWLSGYVNACEGIDVDIFMTHEPTEKVRGSIGRQIRNNRAKLKETSDTSTEASNVASIVESGFYLLEGLAAGDSFFYANVIFTVTGDSLKEVEHKYNALEKMAQSMGVHIRRTMFQMEDAFESVLPLCQIKGDIYKKSRRNMLGNGAASFYPFISFELQDPNGIMLGVNQTNNSLVAVDVFDTARHANANGAILGKSGYGKTFTAQLLAIRMRLQGIQTFIITPLKGKEDYKRACDQIDGQYVALGPGSSYYINVFDIHAPDNESLKEISGEDREESLLAKKVQDLHTFFHLVVRNLSQEEEQLLDGYIYRVYGKFGITENNDSIYIPGTKKYKEFPLLEDLYNEIENVPDLHRVYSIMTPMVKGSLSVYNKHTNVDLNNKYIVFDMNGTKGSNLILSMFITLDFVWSKIKENRLDKKAVFIDEAWQLIGSASNEMAAEYVKEIFKTIRAFGGAAFVMTQEVNDFFSLNDGEYGKAIIGNSDTKICLHLDKVEASMVRDIMSLSNEEFRAIQELPKGNGLVATGNNKLFVNFKASEFEFEVITTDPEFLRKKRAEEIAERIEMEKAYEISQNEAKSLVNAQSLQFEDDSIDDTKTRLEGKNTANESEEEELEIIFD